MALDVIYGKLDRSVPANAGEREYTIYQNGSCHLVLYHQRKMSRLLSTRTGTVFIVTNIFHRPT